MLQEQGQKVEWEKVKVKSWLNAMRRAKVPGGWLVWIQEGFAGGLTFLPDPNYEWNPEVK